MNENFEEYILDRKDKAGNFIKLKNFYTNIWAGAKDGKYLKNDIELYELFKNNDEIEKCKNLNQLYFAGIPKEKDDKTLKKIVENIINPEINNLSPENLLKALNEYNIKNDDKEKLSLYQSFISKYCHWHHEVNISKNHFPIFDKNVKYSLVYYQMTGAEIKNYEHLKYFVDKFIEEYLPDKYENLDDKYKIDDRDKSRPEKLTGVDRINLKLEINEEIDSKNTLHKEISIYRLVDKFLWLQYEIYSKILKKI